VGVVFDYQYFGILDHSSRIILSAL
jgi:hypothetical protein